MLHIKSMRNSYPECPTHANRMQCVSAMLLSNSYTTHIVRDAWELDQHISVHGWVYSLEDELLRKMGLTASSVNEAEDASASAIKSIFNTHHVEEVQITAY